MITGTGIDIIEISRIKKNMVNPSFMEKVYTKAEQEYIFKKGNPAQTAAGIFAAKEAAAKAFGTGLGKLSFTDIEILHNENGQPYVMCNGEQLLCSISHCKDYATAIVIKRG